MSRRRKSLCLRQIVYLTVSVLLAIALLAIVVPASSRQASPQSLACVRLSVVDYCIHLRRDDVDPCALKYLNVTVTRSSLNAFTHTPS
jgi:hypothetical protein